MSEPNPFDFFDEIHCISCDHHPDRWDISKQQFSRVGIEERVMQFSATENDEQYGIPNPEGEERHYATLLCHREIVKRAKAKNLDNVLIFEDDVLFLTEDLRALSNAIEQLKALPSWQLFYLGIKAKSFDMEKVSKNLLFGKKGKPTKIKSTHAYAIHRSMFDPIIAYVGDAFKAHIDVWLPEEFDFYCLNPMLSVEDQDNKAAVFKTQFFRKFGPLRSFYRTGSRIRRRILNPSAL